MIKIKKIAKHYKNHFGIEFMQNKNLGISDKLMIEWGCELLKDFKENAIIEPKTSLENFVNEKHVK